MMTDLVRKKEFQTHVGIFIIFEGKVSSLFHPLHDVKSFLKKKEKSKRLSNWKLYALK